MGRTRFHEELELLELDVLGMGELSERAVGKSVGALIDHQDAQAHAVVAADDEIDEKYMSIETRILQVMALQTPVAGDLRLISAILHSNLHLERVGDLSVDIAEQVGFLITGEFREFTDASHPVDITPDAG